MNTVQMFKKEKANGYSNAMALDITKSNYWFSDKIFAPSNFKKLYKNN